MLGCLSADGFTLDLGVFYSLANIFDRVGDFDDVLLISHSSHSSVFGLSLRVPIAERDFFYKFLPLSSVDG